MNTRCITFTEKNVAVFDECELGSVGDNQVLVHLQVSTISSGTERALITGEPNVSVVNKGAVAEFPRRGGYSGAGIVEAVGKNVTSVKVGDRVAAFWGVHSEYGIYNEENVLKIEYDDVSFENASISNIATFSLAAIRKCRLEMGESSIVMGLGVLGMIAVKLLKIGGAYPVIAVDPIESKREQALKNGADYAFDPFEEGFVEKVKAVTNGGVNVAIEVTGSGKALDQVLDCMAKLGRVALLGCTRHSDFTIDYYFKVHGPGISLIGAHNMARPQTESSFSLWTHRDDAATILKLVHGKRIDLTELVDEIRSPKDCGEVYTRLVNDKQFPVTQFDWRNI